MMMPLASALRSYPARSNGSERRVHIVQGEFQVSDEPGIVLTTLLGSCVAACVRDPRAKVGGMNHFLLPGSEADSAGDSRGDSTRCGVHAMELLVNGLLQAGAHRDRLEAKLFGGGRMLEGLTDIGSQNAAFAERFLQKEGIAYAGGSLRGDRGRRVQFWPVSGRARQITIEQDEATVFAAERRAKAKPSSAGSVELF